MGGSAISWDVRLWTRVKGECKRWAKSDISVGFVEELVRDTQHIHFRGAQLMRGGGCIKEMVIKCISRDAGPQRSPPCLAMRRSLVTLAWGSLMGGGGTA